ncbi:protein phosphatase [Blastocystis sp. subtype 4]|uniref:protein phosphatase n=1 Tax=Blastocystis sp. subtype 4 TaxID=944170 RepID=UPI000711DD7A|nr:protein phosphatase [Blastocystis sp. subtype 4]KNB44506.1 protein phosphatase [Blastocystis sp. subtype 4]|eukprot:XP_014527955.1 protein phosphatase [Blastocystis sp. subtype 4]
MWDLILLLGSLTFVLYAQMDLYLLYRSLTASTDEIIKENYGELQSFPEVTDFYCPTCGRHFSSYDHCHRHSELRNHNKSSIYCQYSFRGLPKCQRSAPVSEEEYQFGSCCFAGRKRRMEDIHWVSAYDIINKNVQRLPVIYGLCDGHLGTNAAQYLANQLEAFLLMRNHDRLPSAIDVKDAFQKARDTYIHDYCYSGDISGSTSTIVIKNEGELIIANIGDSSAYVCCDEKGNPIPVTASHRVTNDNERKRILAIGGKIKDKRLFGHLSLSRSFGDCPYSSFLSVEPFIYTMTINRELHRFIILASDGVWDYLSIKEAKDIVDHLFQDDISFSDN